MSNVFFIISMAALVIGAALLIWALVDSFYIMSKSDELALWGVIFLIVFFVALILAKACL